VGIGVFSPGDERGSDATVLRVGFDMRFSKNLNPSNASYTPAGDKIASGHAKRKFGALQCLISLRQAPVWFLR